MFNGKIPYERFIAWTAGPVAAIAGWLATKLVEHTAFLGQVGLGKSQVAHGITVATTFGITTLVTYAAHHKWLDNLPQWWFSQQQPQPQAFALEAPDNPEVGPPDPDGPHLNDEVWKTNRDAELFGANVGTMSSVSTNPPVSETPYSPPPTATTDPKPGGAS